MDVSTCYCGTSRAAVEAQARREEQRNARAFPSFKLLSGALVMVVVFYLAFTRNDTPRAPAPSAPPSRSVESAPETQAVSPSPSYTSERKDIGVAMARLPLATTGERAGIPTPIPVVASRIPSPTPSATPERSEVDIERDAGEKRLEQTLARLEVERISLSANAKEFEAVCLSTRGDPRSCERLFNDISSSGDAIGRGLEGAEEDARRSWVSPGLVRDLRLRHRLDESTWRDVAESVHRLTTRYRGGS